MTYDELIAERDRLEAKCAAKDDALREAIPHLGALRVTDDAVEYHRAYLKARAALSDDGSALLEDIKDAFTRIIQERANAKWPFNVRADNMAKIAGEALARMENCALESDDA